MTERETIERDTLQTRARILEAAMICIAREIEPTFECPEVSFLTLQRIASVARQSLPADLGEGALA